jgi:hypothetical protein
VGARVFTHPEGLIEEKPMRALLAFVTALAVALPARRPSPKTVTVRHSSAAPTACRTYASTAVAAITAARTDSVYVYDRGYQGDSAWRSDSFNDWWHDNPDRAYPRWVQNNQGCPPERMWWSGTTLRC